MRNQSPKILIVEDDPDIAELLVLHLRDNHYDVLHAADGNLGLEEALTGEYQLALLDIQLPGTSGLDICKAIREKYPEMAILMLTSRAEEIDKILGLEVGADDYVTKPFSIHELVARVRALLRRVDAVNKKASDESEEKVQRFAALEINYEKRRVERGGELVRLTSTEYELLALLSRSPGRVYSRDELLSYVWDYQHGGYQNTVSSHINRLRNKIEESPSEPKFILTVWGVGYRFAERGEL